MKICFWGNVYNALIGKTKGGGELQIALLAKGLAELGYEVIIIDSSITNDINIGNIELLSIKKRTENPLKRFIIFYQLLINVEADYYYARIRSGIHFFGYLAAKKNNSRFIIGMAHDLDTLNLKERYINYYSQVSLLIFLKKILHCELIFDYLVRKADCVISQHKTQKKNLVLKGNIKSEICYNIYPYDIKKISDTTPRGEYFIFVGSLDKRKGIDEIYKIITNCNQIEFVIIGRCRDEYSKPIISNLQKLDNVKWLGQLEHKELFKYLEESKALISVSKMEGFPNAFIEAWAHGVPTLSLNVDPGNLMKENNLGICYYGDVANLINSIVDFKDNYNSKDIQKYVINNHSKNNINKFIKIISEVK